MMSSLWGRATRLGGRATRSLLLLAPFFFLTYGAATLLTSMRTEVGSIVYAWERSIPFWPWTIVPYWSIDVFYGISLFICTTDHELDVHVRRLLTAQLVAVICFILFPLTFTFDRVIPDGFAGWLFNALAQFDRPFNQAPSLHIALLVILWTRYAHHVSGFARVVMDAWFALVGASVLTTYQHHFIDVPTGALLGFACLWLWPEDGPGPFAEFRRTDDPARARLARYYTMGTLALLIAGVAIGGAGLWLIWPAVSLGLVAANYGFLGAAGFQKDADGAMGLGARWLYAPYIAAAWLNSRIWTRRDAASVPIGDDVFLGRIPARRIAFASVIDLCAELPGLAKTPAWRAMPMLDLVAPAPGQLRSLAGMIERTRTAGPVLVCCALGYGRSAAAVATWLLITDRVDTIDAAYERIRRVRPGVVVTAATRDAIDTATRST